MTATTTQIRQARTASTNGSASTGNGNSGNGSAFSGSQQPGVRQSFTYLAGALPAAKVDVGYWEVLHAELGDIPEPVLMAVVREYIRTNENAYRMPTVAELLKLSAKQEELQEIAAMQAAKEEAREQAMQEECDALQAQLRRVTATVPQEDRDEIAARIKAAYDASPDWVTAAMLIYTYLIDLEGPQPGWYSPTALIAAGAVSKMKGGKPTGDPSKTPTDALVNRIVGAYPGKFQARYDLSLEPLLNPDRVALAY